MAENTESILIIVVVFGILIISSIFLLFRNKKQIPDIITDLEIKPDNSNFEFSLAKLSWTPPNHNSSKIIEYQIEFQNTNEKS
ncbi:MAG: fibronectin type III domain-containing protein, partial [Candidatus Nitrosopelagicus sp.]|nr:fibronectin type III domain-containing protein [Candidatus Nitrosopelagicus sp.]